MERDCGVSTKSTMPAEMPKKIYPSFEIDLKKFPEFADLKYEDEVTFKVNVCVAGVYIDDYSRRIRFDVKKIDVNEADASLKKLTKKPDVNEADVSLTSLTEN
jgi:hypothetical protein